VLTRFGQDVAAGAETAHGEDDRGDSATTSAVS
jgi:hypothetical protein